MSLILDILDALRELLFYHPATGGEWFALVGTWLGALVVLGVIAWAGWGLLAGAERPKLVGRYLGRKIGPLFAALAVTVCTMMVIIVISVMGGFLRTLEHSLQSITGDLTLSGPSLGGFEHYQELIDELEALPEVEAATPVVVTYGLMQWGQTSQPVQVMGIDPADYGRVLAYRDVLVWDAARVDTVLRRYFEKFNGPSESWDTRQRERYEAARGQWRKRDLSEAAMDLTVPPDLIDDEAGADPLAVVVGLRLNPYSRGDGDDPATFDAIVGRSVVLTVVPIGDAGQLQKLDVTPRKATIVNAFKSGHFEVDSLRVYVALDRLQRLLDMDRRESQRFDPETGETLPGVDLKPARASNIVIKAAPGVELPRLQGAVDAAVYRVSQRLDLPPLWSTTWRQQHQTLLTAVGNEKRLVTFLFAIISVVALIMVLITLWNVVLQKTRDIGTLRAIGASRWGILELFLGYGLAVGFTGAAVGTLLAVLIVTHLNNIQAFLRDGLGSAAFLLVSALLLMPVGLVVGLALWRRRWAIAAAVATGGLGLVAGWFVLGIRLHADRGEPITLAQWLNDTLSVSIWNPEVYAFDRIPDSVDPKEILVIVAVAIATSTLGAIIPAVLAARLDPIEALRYE